jgi:capsular exopolysaccharide synthesis family protein
MSRVYEALARAMDERPVEPLRAATHQVPTLEQYSSEGGQLVDRPAPVVPSPPQPNRGAPQPVAGLYPVGRPAPDFEGYSSVATVLQQAQLDRGLQALLVTSAIPGEGKTLTVVNLALTLSESYARRVLIVDADLRQPSVHRLLGINAAAGLTDALMRPGGEPPFVQLSPRLTVLPAGRSDPNPVALLSPDRVEPLLGECIRRFDWVLVDTPPLTAGADALLLTRFVQGVVLVIRAGAAPYSLVEKTVADLGRDCIVGTVLNGVDEEAVPSSSQYYGRSTSGR